MASTKPTNAGSPVSVPGSSNRPSGVDAVKARRFFDENLNHGAVPHRRELAAEMLARIRFERQGGEAALKLEQLEALRVQREAREREDATRREMGQSKATAKPAGRPRTTDAVMAEYEKRRTGGRCLPTDEAEAKYLEDWRPKSAKGYKPPAWSTIARRIREARRGRKAQNGETVS